MTDQMIIDRLRKVSTDLRQDVQTYGTEHHVSLEAAEEVRNNRCADMCDLIADELDENLKYQAELKKKEDAA